MSLLLPNQKSFGLDISDYIIRLINVEKNQIVSAGEINLPTGLISRGIIKQPEKVVELINKLINSVSGKKIKTKYVVACLPEPKTFIKVIDLPDYNDDNLKKILAEEIIKDIPYDIEEIYIDWQKLPYLNKNKLLIGVVPKDILISYQQLLTQAGLIPLVLEIEAAAITRCLINNQNTDNYAQIILDFGFNRTSLIVYDNQTVQFSITILLSGDGISKTIAKTLNFTYTEAEKAKIICGFDEQKCDRALFRILKPVMNTLILRINEAINFYQNHFTDRHEIKNIVLCGGGANFKNLDKMINISTKLNVIKGNVLSNISQKPSKELLPPKDYLSYVSAVGLALNKGLPK